MYLSTLRIENFKNIAHSVFNLNPYVNCFVGENGSGKTNLLDAIHVLCLTKSALGSTDLQCINYNSNYYRLEGAFNAHGSTKGIMVSCVYSNETKKNLKWDGLEYDKMSDHIGKLPIVMIAPDDTDLIREGSEIRRKFFDGLISQMDSEYLKSLLLYNHLLKQRNAVLKQDFPRNDLLELYSNKLIPLNIIIAEKRQKFIADYIDIFQHRYKYLSGEKEIASLVYETDINEHFSHTFSQNIEKDKHFQRTTLGIHTEDFDFTIDGQSVKKFASQGQKKSFVIALKLAQFDILKDATVNTPILLLDDIFDKLDDVRIKKLIDLVTGNHFGQLFVTDARPERSRALFVDMGDRIKFFSFERISQKNN